MRRLFYAGFLIATLSCGGSGGGGYGDNPPPQPQPKPEPSPDEGSGGTAAQSFASLKPTIDRECGRCHNGRIHPLKFDSEAKFKTAGVRSKIERNQMPPDRPLAADAKTQLLAYLKS